MLQLKEKKLDLSDKLKGECQSYIILGSALVANTVTNVCSKRGNMLEINPLNKRTGERKSGMLGNP